MNWICIAQSDDKSRFCNHLFNRTTYINIICTYSSKRKYCNALSQLLPYMDE
uniref:Uncharacterized protein n=1 Tax=Lepeophtheirus salmonis TaxID=72036 RepID=A0A0K2VGY1_LEPSM